MNRRRRECVTFLPSSSMVLSLLDLLPSTPASSPHPSMIVVVVFRSLALARSRSLAYVTCFRDMVTTSPLSLSTSFSDTITFSLHLLLLVSRAVLTLSPLSLSTRSRAVLAVFTLPRAQFTLSPSLLLTCSLRSHHPHHL